MNKNTLYALLFGASALFTINLSGMLYDHNLYTYETEEEDDLFDKEYDNTYPEATHSDSEEMESSDSNLSSPESPIEYKNDHTITLDEYTANENTPRCKLTITEKEIRKETLIIDILKLIYTNPIKAAVDLHIEGAISQHQLQSLLWMAPITNRIVSLTINCKNLNSYDALRHICKCRELRQITLKNLPLEEGPKKPCLFERLKKVSLLTLVDYKKQIVPKAKYLASCFCALKPIIQVKDTKTGSCYTL